MIQLPRALADELIAHASAAAPDEACGVVGIDGDRIVSLVRARNASSRPRVHFTFADDGYLSLIAIEKHGLEPGIYHSHPASPAYPSATDRAEMSGTWPDALQLMISVRAAEPELHAYRINDEGMVTELDLRLVD